jgi:hypothetical protein
MLPMVRFPQRVLHLIAGIISLGTLNSPMLYAAQPYSPTPNVPGYLQFKPYNEGAGFREHNLWWIEEDRIYRSSPLISPDFTGYAFAEVLYMPDFRETSSTLFWVPLPRMPLGESSADAIMPPGSSLMKASQALPQRFQQPEPNLSDPRTYTSWFDEAMMKQRRVDVLRVNAGQQKGFAFETLTPVDWNMSGTRLLIKRRAGVLYTGLRCTDVIVWDKQAGTASLYQELLRALEYHWKTLPQSAEIHPRLAHMAWDIEPLGWQANNDDVFYWRAWAYTEYPEKQRIPLGTWAYHVSMQKPLLIDKDTAFIPEDVATNGVMPVIDQARFPQRYSEKESGDFKRRMQRPRQQQMFF